MNIKGFRRSITAFLSAATAVGTAYVSAADVGVSGAQVQQMSVIATSIVSGLLTVWSMFSPEEAVLPKRFSKRKNKLQDSSDGS